MVRIADEGNGNTPENHGLLIEFAVLRQEEGQLYRRALQDTGQDDAGAEPVAHEDLKRCRNQLRDNADAGLLNDIHGKRSRHEVNSVEGLITDGSPADRSQRRGNGKSRVVRSQIQEGKQHADDGNHQNIFQFPGKCLVLIHNRLLFFTMLRFIPR